MQNNLAVADPLFRLKAHWETLTNVAKEIGTTLRELSSIDKKSKNRRLTGESLVQGFYQTYYLHELGARIHKLRKEKKLGTRDFGELSKDLISRYEKAQAHPDFITLLKIAVKLETSIEYLVFGNESKSPKAKVELAKQAQLLKKFLHSKKNDEEIRKALGEKISFLRKQKSLAQNQLGDDTRISSLERGVGSVKLGVFLGAIARLECSLGDLYKQDA